MTKSNSEWILASVARQESDLKKLIEELRRLSVAELGTVWRALTEELKSRMPNATATIF